VNEYCDIDQLIVPLSAMALRLSHCVHFWHKF